MYIHERRNQDVVVLDLKGRLTIDDGADLLCDKFNSLILKGEPKVLINLGNVPHIDSGALGKLVSCLVHARQAHGSLKIFGLSGRVVELLTITKLITEFDTYDTEQEAIESFKVTVYETARRA
jgi:anti-sigma B factor antagonist